MGTADDVGELFEEVGEAEELRDVKEADETMELVIGTDKTLLVLEGVEEVEVDVDVGGGGGGGGILVVVGFSLVVVDDVVGGGGGGGGVVSGFSVVVVGGGPVLPAPYCQDP